MHLHLNMKIGLYFGSFNPIHMGHLIIAESLLEATDIHEVWFVVSPLNPFKESKDLLAEAHRLKMVELAINNNARLRASDIEFNLTKPSYTIDTLRHLVSIDPKHEFSIIMGEDNLSFLHKWKAIDQLLRDYDIWVYPRLNSLERDDALRDHPRIKMVDAPIIEISATKIRTNQSEGKSIRYLVPDAVKEIIDANGWYRSTPEE